MAAGIPDVLAIDSHDDVLPLLQSVGKFLQGATVLVIDMDAMCFEQFAYIVEGGAPAGSIPAVGNSFLAQGIFREVVPGQVVEDEFLRDNGTGIVVGLQVP